MFYRIKDNMVLDHGDYKYAENCINDPSIANSTFDKNSKKYLVQNNVLVLNPDYNEEAEKEAEYQEYLSTLTIRRDIFFNAMLNKYSLKPDDIKAQMTVIFQQLIEAGAMTIEQVTEIMLHYDNTIGFICTEPFVQAFLIQGVGNTSEQVIAFFENQGDIAYLAELTEAQKEQQTRSKINALSMTRGDFNGVLIKQFTTDLTALRLVIVAYLETSEYDEVTRKLYLNSFDNALNFYRSHPLFTELLGIPPLNLTVEMVDTMFIEVARSKGQWVD